MRDISEKRRRNALGRAVLFSTKKVLIILLLLCITLSFLSLELPCNTPPCRLRRQPFRDNLHKSRIFKLPCKFHASTMWTSNPTTTSSSVVALVTGSLLFLLFISTTTIFVNALTVPSPHYRRQPPFLLHHRDDANQQYILHCPSSEPVNPDCKTQGYCAGALYVPPIEMPGVSASQAEECTPQGCTCVAPEVSIPSIFFSPSFSGVFPFRGF